MANDAQALIAEARAFAAGCGGCASCELKLRLADALEQMAPKVPMTEREIVFALCNSEYTNDDRVMQEVYRAGIRAAERFHGIKETP